jgi:hypothetical protein
MNEHHEELPMTKPEAGSPRDRSPKYTIASTPPTRAVRQKRSRWAELFAECRSEPGEWRRTVEWFSKTTAGQIASDIRSAHGRDLAKSRLRGLLETDRWEAVWGLDSTDPDPSHHYVWLRYVGVEAAAA